ncbi:glycerophosphoryl diester phosphodiesterase [Nonomuraea muscovyensis]|uniref:Glycerophosphoryl diester phosphodiesterase n=1 Tax=Nonomuraea muscovyensis TaxID=1124761 RepID=A0A7X0EWB7_9ACTN|nr:glycerophosphodiester phosphodiesterase [Nonomuraea muscovyensis]MBB6343655.1 glycerophosphoryl diester phosphodiesterase [Nonomuraea muscovyensis]
MFLTIAHRGDPLVHRENTLPSLLSAVGKGANTLEFDLRLTRDGRIVLLHDASLERLWGHPADVADLTLDQVRGLGGEDQVPAFEEVLDAFGDTTFLVDLKTDDVVEPAVALLRRHGDAFGRSIFVAARRGGREALARLRADAPDAAIGLDWTEERPPPRDLLDALRPQYFGPRWKVADAAGVPAMRERGYHVWVGPLDDEAEVVAAMEYGVDGIVVDDISSLLRLRADAGTP